MPYWTPVPGVNLVNEDLAHDWGIRLLRNILNKIDENNTLKYFIVKNFKRVFILLYNFYFIYIRAYLNIIGRITYFNLHYFYII